jgi:tetratricopeptide (TPR) repeat protein
MRRFKESLVRRAGWISRTLRVSATVLGFFSIVEGADPKIPESLAKWRGGLNLAWSGKPNAARARLLEIHRHFPDNACGYYFPAMIDFDWALAGYDSATDPEHAQVLLDRAIEVGRNRIEAQPADAAATYCLAAAYGTRSAYRFDHGDHISGAFDAKKARSLMLGILEQAPSCEDCRFWTGAYDYMSATLPSIVKFLKSLLFFPGGDRERGLRVLDAAAQRGDFERYHAFTILHVAYREIEHDTKNDQSVLERWHAAFPDAPDVAVMLAQVLASSGRDGRSRSIALFRDVLDRVKAGKIEDEEEASAAVGLANVFMEDAEPETAIEVLRPVAAKKRGRKRDELLLSRFLGQALNQAGLHSEAVAMLQDLKKRYPVESDLTKVETAATQLSEEESKIYKATLPARRLLRDEKLEELEAALVKLKAETDDHPQVESLIGWINFDAKRDGLARQSFQKVIDVRDTRPTYMLAWSYMGLGWLRDLAGDRGGAKDLYRLAIKAAGGDDSTRHSAEYYLKNPYKR